MASMCFFSSSVLHYESYHNRSRQVHIHKRSVYSSQSTSMALTAVEPLARRSANYAPSLWSFDDIQSLSSECTGEDYKARADTLKDAVKMMIPKVGNLLSTLELIDDLQRLGISYHFQDELRNLLEKIYYNYYKTNDKWHIQWI
ncbi:putative R-linalool synthase [Helianthus annuus]|nr:putative R-linalool synthase [Helianthus annuus]